MWNQQRLRWQRIAVWVVGACAALLAANNVDQFPSARDVSFDTIFEALSATSISRLCLPHDEPIFDFASPYSDAQPVHLPRCDIAEPYSLQIPTDYKESSPAPSRL